MRNTTAEYKWYGIAGCLLLLSLIGCTEVVTKSDVLPRSANELIGTWKMVSAIWGGIRDDTPKRYTVLRHESATHSISVWINPESGQVVEVLGGMIRSLKDGIYVGTVTYGFGGVFERLRDQDHFSTWKIEGDKWYSRGWLADGMTTEEVWERIAGEQQQTAHKLIGSWKLVHAKYDGRESGLPKWSTTLKLVTPTQTIRLRMDPVGGARVVTVAGGMNSLRNDTYIENADYGFGVDFERRRGEALSFTWKVEGDKWYNTSSDGKMIDEVWERVQPRIVDARANAYNLSEVDRPPRIIRKIDPLYPFAAKKENIQGKVILRFIVTREGEVILASVMKGEPPGVFDDSALEAILKWRFKPAMKDGKAVDVIIIAPLEFELVEDGVTEKEQRPLSTDERIGTEEVAAALADYQAAWQEQDLDKMVAIYSEDWRNSNGVDKPWLRAYFESLVAQDAARSTLVDIGKVVVNGDRAIVMPITYDQPGPRGRESYRCTMKKEADGVWRFVYDEAVH